MITIIDLIPKLFSVLFVLLVYLFIIRIIKMVNSDIAVMMKKKSTGKVGTYLKLLNIRSSLKFPISESYEIAADVKIGRDRSCEIRIDDPFLSSVHAEILCREDACYLHDLESTNGTLLNGTPVEGDPIELINGDKINFGQLSFIYISDKDDEA